MRRAAAGWRTAARLARREVRRRPGRTVLVVTLIAVPVAGVTFAAILSRTTTPTLAERRAAELGRADDEIFQLDTAVHQDAAAFAAAIAPLYPDGSQVVAFTTGEDAITRDDGHLESVVYSDHPLDEPLLEGTLRLVEGRVPRAPGEVAVSPEVLDQTSAGIGDRIELALLGEATVTGVVVDRGNQRSGLAVGTVPARSAYATPVAYVGAPPGFQGPDVSALEQANGWSLREQGGGLDTTWEAMRGKLAVIYIWGGVALATVAVIATAAFAVAARRQLRVLGLLSASGVPPAGLRQVVLLQGTATGLAGGLLGMTLGLAAAAALAPHLNDYVDDYVDGLSVHPLDLLIPLALGVLAATAAAALPARTASRVPVLAALAGRKPQARLSPTIPSLGLVALILGLFGLGSFARHPDDIGWGWGLLSALGILLGGCALAPWIVTYTEPLARRLRGGARVAARDLARQRLRSGAVVAAVMAPAALAVVAMTNLATHDARDASEQVEDERYEIQDDQALFSAVGGTTTPPGQVQDQLDEARSILPGAAEVDVGVVVPEGGNDFGQRAILQIDTAGAVGETDADVVPGSRSLVVNDSADLRDVGAPDAAVDALEAGQVVVFADRLPAGTSFAVPTTDIALDERDVFVSDMAIPHGDTIAVISPATAERWGLSTLYYGTLFQSPHRLSDDQRADLEAVVGECSALERSCQDQQLRDQLLGEESISASSFELSYPDRDQSHLRQEAAAAGGILIFSLLVVAAALSLTSAESRDDRALLDAIGAPPRVRRSMTAWQAGLLPALAMALAIPGGLAVALAFTAGDVTITTADFRIPWLTVTMLGLGVPVISAGVAWLITSVSGRRRRDLSTLALAPD